MPQKTSMNNQETQCTHSDKQWRISDNNPADVMCGHDVIAIGTLRKHAAQIVLEHNRRTQIAEALASSEEENAALVKQHVGALEVLRSTLRPVLRDREVRNNVDRIEGHVLVALNQIDAALAALNPKDGD